MRDDSCATSRAEGMQGASRSEPRGFDEQLYQCPVHDPRLRRQVPAARIIVGLWSLSEHDITEAGDAVRNIGADLVVNSLPQAVELLSVAPWTR